MKKKLFIFMLLFISIKSYADKLQLNICANDLRIEKQKKGNNSDVNIDILKLAIQNLKHKMDINLKIEFAPWSRCLLLLEKGEMDAALNASYVEDRAVYLDYPPDAGPLETKACASKYKSSCSGYIVITLKSNHFEYEGNVNLLPIPVRVSRGYSITTLLENIFHENVKVSKSDIISIKKLIRDQTGSVIAHFDFPDDLKRFESISNQIKINKKLFELKSYYIAFSKKSNFPKKDRLVFWKEVNSVSGNKKIVKKLISKYYK